MRARTQRRAAARIVAVATVLAGLTLAAPLAAPDAAATTPRVTHRPVVCERARAQWARLAATDVRLKRAFERAEGLQAQLLRSGRARLAHRLDARLRYLRQLHSALVQRVGTIKARVAGRCSARPPTLTSF